MISVYLILYGILMSAMSFACLAAIPLMPIGTILLGNWQKYHRQKTQRVKIGYISHANWKILFENPAEVPHAKTQKLKSQPT